MFASDLNPDNNSNHPICPASNSASEDTPLPSFYHLKKNPPIKKPLIPGGSIYLTLSLHAKKQKKLLGNFEKMAKNGRFFRKNGH